MRPRLTSQAEADLADILRTIAEENPSAASGFASAFDATLERLGIFPKLGRIVHAGEVRAILVGRYRYRLLYVDQGSEGVVVRNIRSTWRLNPWEHGAPSVEVE
ncbi:MAG: type II toxin-antitoxin system RelE/ParE family toxin [Bauldia sp.]|nr:type II toxin-antitoxin system RelE/ParE family toxin [Bauldia sp.]